MAALILITFCMVVHIDLEMKLVIFDCFLSQVNSPFFYLSDLPSRYWSGLLFYSYALLLNRKYQQAIDVLMSLWVRNTLFVDKISMF